MHSTDIPSLGPNFLWGVSTAAYQIEGAVGEGGRGPSSWDAFCAEPGRISDGSSGAVACDHYHRYGGDVELMRQLGVDAYRFSFAWPRIQPTGSGAVNADGLDFYDRLVDRLLAAGIQPAPTLFHWDTPLALEEQGGWLNRDITERFAEYAHLIGSHFADRIPRWITINEPVVLTMLGYAMGIHAPGQQLGLGALPAAHHQLLAHGRAVTALRDAGVGNIGIANNHSPIWPADDTEEDDQAARQYSDFANWLFADPILLGRYPAELEPLLPAGASDDLAEISVPIDWYGINYYNPTRVGAASPEGGGSANPRAGGIDGQQLEAALPISILDVEGYPLTDFGWPVVPAALTELLISVKDRYADRLPPIYLTENGCAINDGPDDVGRVADSRRI